MFIFWKLYFHTTFHKIQPLYIKLRVSCLYWSFASTQFTLTLPPCSSVYKEHSWELKKKAKDITRRKSLFETIFLFVCVFVSKNTTNLFVMKKLKWNRKKLKEHKQNENPSIPFCWRNKNRKINALWARKKWHATNFFLLNSLGPAIK